MLILVANGAYCADCKVSIKADEQTSKFDKMEKDLWEATEKDLAEALKK